MDIKVLRYFLALSTEKSITAAAEYLHLTQPTLSRQLSELENELGVSLFIRGSRNITLTNEGIRLRKRAEEILSLVEKTQFEFQHPTEIVNGDVYIGCGETHAMEYIVDKIKSFRDRYPNVRFHIFSGNADAVAEKIDTGLMDFGVFIEPSNISKYDAIQLPQKSIWGVLMKKNSPLSKKQTIHPEDLWNEPLILAGQSLIKHIISKWIKRDFKELNIIATYNLIFNATLMVKKGIGYAMGLDNLINTTGDSELCFRPLEPELTVAVHFSWKKYQVFSKPAELFLQHVKTSH